MEYQQFATNWDFKITILFQHYPQSNGLVGKTVKKYHTKKYPSLGLLIHCSTPCDHGLPPAEVLMDRELRSNLPMSQNRKKRMQLWRQKFSGGWCRKITMISMEHKTLQPNDTVHICEPVHKTWIESGIIQSEEAPILFIVKTRTGSLLQWNKINLL